MFPVTDEPSTQMTLNSAKRNIIIAPKSIYIITFLLVFVLNEF